MPAHNPPAFIVVKAPVKLTPKAAPARTTKKKRAQPISGRQGDLGSPQAHYLTQWAKNPLTGQDEPVKVPRVVVEPRERSSSGQVIATGARVINESPLERMYRREELYPGDHFRNEVLYQAGLRLRADFEGAGVKLGGNPSMEPRVDKASRGRHQRGRGYNRKRTMYDQDEHAKYAQHDQMMAELRGMSRRLQSVENMVAVSYHRERREDASAYVAPKDRLVLMWARKLGIYYILFVLGGIVVHLWPDLIQ